MNLLTELSIIYFFIANGSYLLILLFGYMNARRLYLQSQLDLNSRLAPLKSLTPISILMPAYNEEKSIIESVQSMLRLEYPDFEVIVCNDGSKDGTMERMKTTFRMVEALLHPPQSLPSNPVRGVWFAPDYPNLMLIDKENGGKADALNAAINYSRHPLICCVDSDSLLDAQGLSRVALPFLEDPEGVIATGGTISLINTYGENVDPLSQSKREEAIAWRWLDLVQATEYMRAFLVGRMGWDFFSCTMIISGAFGLFRKNTVIKVGGYTKGSIGEDMELLLRMHAYAREHSERYEVRFLPDPVCFTEAPSDLSTLSRQRARWQQGLLDSLWRTKHIAFRRLGGRIGWFALPYLLVFEALSAPMELICYISILFSIAEGSADSAEIALALCAIMLFGVILNLAAIMIDQVTFRRYQNPKDVFKLICGAFIEQFGFRQIHLYWRLKGSWAWLRGKHQWGEMKRRGLGKAA